MKLSDYVIDFVVRQGVKHLFMLPGGGAMHLNESLGQRRADIEFVCNLHEQAVGIAAEAYVKVTNGLGVAMVTTGPGGTNAVTGVAGAWLDSMPCLFISGQVKRADLKLQTGLRQLGSQEVDIVSIVESITKYAVTIIDPKSIRFHLEKAVYLAKSGRPGPVWIDIPMDVQAADIDVENLLGFVPDKKGTGSRSAGHAGRCTKASHRCWQRNSRSRRNTGIPDRSGGDGCARPYHLARDGSVVGVAPSLRGPARLDSPARCEFRAAKL